MEGQLDFATAFFILLAAPEFYQPLRTLGAHFHTSLNTREAAAELFAFLDKEELITEVTMDRAQVPMVELRHVSAHYPGAEVSALQDISFTVAPGEVVALAGRSGSGKTTVLNLLQGFLKPQDGEITMQCAPAVIQQRPYIFAGSILDNLRFGSENLSEERILEVCRQTGLAELLRQLPDGLHTQVGQGGAGLSGGQRQMIAMVRAICQQKNLILLDEATANLDLLTEQQLNRSLQQLLQGRTVLLVAHRLTTLQLADRVIVLEKGAVIEQGTPKELLGQQGAYYELVRKGLES